MSKRDVTVTGDDLKGVLAPVHESRLSDGDKAVLSAMLNICIELKSLVEHSTKEHGGKKVLASLPFGFDIVG